MDETESRNTLLLRVEELERRNRALESEAGDRREALRLLTLQRNLATAVSTAETIEDGLHLCLESTLDACRMDSGGIYLFDEETGDLVLRVHRGLSPPFVAQVSRYAPDSPNSHFIRRGWATYTLREKLDVPTVDVESREGLKAIGVVPLQSGRRTIGCINIASHTREVIPLPARIATETMAALIGRAVAHLKTKASLQRSEMHLKTLLESASGFAVYRMAFDETAPYSLRMTFVSPSIEEILGHSPEALEVKDYYENIHPDDREAVMEAHRSAFKTSKFEMTARFYHPRKKDWVWIQAISVAVRDDAGSITAVNGLLIDVTEKNAVEHRLRERERELEAQSRNLDEVNTALEILLEKRSQEKRELEDRIAFNIQQLVEPYLVKLGASDLTASQRALVGIVAGNLKNVAGALPSGMDSILTMLTPTEIRVVNLIRQGKTTKEIADVLCLSERTVGSHRSSVRSKLGLKNRSVNLRSYLLYNT